MTDHDSINEPPVSPKQRVLWMTVRQVLLMLLSAVEAYLGLERSVEPRHKQKKK